MKKAFWLIPLGLIIISIVFSILSFNLSSEIKKGYLLLNKGEISSHYSGNYNVILGNVDEQIQYIKLTNNIDSITLNFFDENKAQLESLDLSIKNTDSSLENGIFSNILSTDYIDVENINENIFNVKLTQNSDYIFQTQFIVDDPSIEQLDYALYYLDEAMYYQQSVYSNVMITSFIFCILSVGTLGGYYFVKKP